MAPNCIYQFLSRSLLKKNERTSVLTDTLLGKDKLNNGRAAWQVWRLMGNRH